MAPLSAPDSLTTEDGGVNEPSLDAIIKPGVDTVRSTKAPARRAIEVTEAAVAWERSGREEFGLPPVTTQDGGVDLEALTDALQTYVADRMIPANSVSDLGVLVEMKFLASLPTPPAGMKYIWDNRLRVSITAND